MKKIYENVRGSIIKKDNGYVVEVWGDEVPCAYLGGAWKLLEKLTACDYEGPIANTRWQEKDWTGAEHHWVVLWLTWYGAWQVFHSVRYSNGFTEQLECRNYETFEEAWDDAADYGPLALVY